MTTYVICTDCDGLGEIGCYGVTAFTYTCAQCGGTGEMPEFPAPYAVASDVDVDAEAALSAMEFAEEMARWLA